MLLSEYSVVAKSVSDRAQRKVLKLARYVDALSVVLMAL